MAISLVVYPTFSDIPISTPSRSPGFGATSSADAMCTWNSMTFSVKPARLHNESIWAGGIVSTCHRGSNRQGTDGKMDGHTDGKWWKRMEIPWNTYLVETFCLLFFPCAFEDSQIKSKFLSVHPQLDRAWMKTIGTDESESEKWALAVKHLAEALQVPCCLIWIITVWHRMTIHIWMASDMMPRSRKDMFHK